MFLKNLEYQFKILLFSATFFLHFFSNCISLMVVTNVKMFLGFT